MMISLHLLTKNNRKKFAVNNTKRGGYFTLGSLHYFPVRSEEMEVTPAELA
jgi:hypothetical protein